jgi:hypothetical protein
MIDDLYIDVFIDDRVIGSTLVHRFIDRRIDQWIVASSDEPMNPSAITTSIHKSSIIDLEIL